MWLKHWVNILSKWTRLFYMWVYTRKTGQKADFLLGDFQNHHFLIFSLEILSFTIFPRKECYRIPKERLRPVIHFADMCLICVVGSFHLSLWMNLPFFFILFSAFGGLIYVLSDVNRCTDGLLSLLVESVGSPCRKSKGGKRSCVSPASLQQSPLWLAVFMKGHKPVHNLSGCQELLHPLFSLGPEVVSVLQLLSLVVFFFYHTNIIVNDSFITFYSFPNIFVPTVSNLNFDLFSWFRKPSK